MAAWGYVTSVIAGALLAGALLQIWLLLRHALTRRVVRDLALLAALPAVLFGALYGMGLGQGKLRSGPAFDDIYSGEAIGVVWLYLVTLAALVAWRFRSEILPQINEAVLLIYNVLALFVLLKIFVAVRTDTFTVLHGLLFALSLPMLLTFLAAFIPVRLGILWDVGSYVWFIIMGVLLTLFQFFAGMMAAPAGPWWGLTRLLMLGMLTVYLIVQLTYLVLLIPVRAGGSTYRWQLARVREYLRFLAGRQHGAQLRPRYALVIAVTTGAVLTLNARWNILPSDILVGLVLVATPQLATLRSAQTPPFDPFAPPT